MSPRKLANMPLGSAPFDLTVETDGMTELKCGTSTILLLRDTEHGTGEKPWWVALYPGGYPALPKGTPSTRHATALACVKEWLKFHNIEMDV